MMNEKNEQTAAHQAADMVDNVADGIRSAAHSVSGSVRNAAQTVRDTAGKAADAVQDTCEEAGQMARDHLNLRRAQARALESSLETCVRDNPKSSVLVAVALGMAI